MSHQLRYFLHHAMQVDIENLDVWALQFVRKHRFISFIGLLFLMAVSIAPFVVEFMMEERLLTQADVYDTSVPLFYLHLFTDLAIGLAYFFITSVLIYVTYKAGRALPFLWAFVAFGVFIVACGVTHFMEAFVLWQPVYWIAGGVKWLTAAVSVGTAIAIPFLVPHILQLIEISKTAHERKVELQKSNKELQKLADKYKEQTEVLQRQKEELEKNAQEYEKMNTFMIGRENAMLELKEKIRKLEEQQSSS